MSTTQQPITTTRSIVMGSAALTDGFGLLGFETHPNADVAQLETVLLSLIASGEPALVMLEPHLARCDCGPLRQLREEGGRVVITEIPPLNAPADYHPEVEDMITRLLGSHALKEPGNAA